MSPATFDYQVRDRTGKVIRGRIEAESPSIVATKLKGMGYAPIAITQANSGLKTEIKMPGFGNRVKLKDLAVSSGSACTSASLEPSYVLRALGLNDELAHSSLRFSFGRFTTEADVDTAVTQLRSAVEKLRELSPLWDMYKDGVDLDSIEWAAH